jgi:hypothetical protein
MADSRKDVDLSWGILFLRGRRRLILRIVYGLGLAGARLTLRIVYGLGLANNTKGKRPRVAIRWYFDVIYNSRNCITIFVIPGA